MEPGSRVVDQEGNVGIVEILDGGLAVVRYLTPRNEPSRCTTTCSVAGLTEVPPHVVPMPKSDAWWAEARALQWPIAEVRPEGT